MQSPLTLFSEIQKQWAGRPLTSLETAVNYIARTTTTEGLRVRSYLDSRRYEKGVKISDEIMETLELECTKTLGSWNYTVYPN